MAAKPWQEKSGHKVVTAEKALSYIKNGQTIFIAPGGADPTVLTDTLETMSDRFSDIRIIQLLGKSGKRLARPELSGSFRYNTFYIGRGVEEAVAAGTADYTPMNLSELPRAIADGIVLVDVALIQVTVPDRKGRCSLGVSVGATKAAVESAKLVIAQVNENMVHTMGDSEISTENIDFLVEGTAPLWQFPVPDLDPISLTIGRHIANIINDGMTLHFDLGAISAATMRYLDTKKDLGIHTDILTDDIMRLIMSGAVNNTKKKINKGKAVANMVLGTQRLYASVDSNPNVGIFPIDYVNDPLVISQNDNTICILRAQEMELSGLARVDPEAGPDVHSLPSSTDFIDGARRSRGGLTLVALPSATADGRRSRIVAESFGKGVFLNRAKVDIVVTEYGSVSLHGLSIRERAIALISIAHPKFRKELLREAKRFHYVDEDQIIPPESGCVYPDQYEFTHTFADGLEVFFRPVKPTDAKRLQRMFYSLSPETIRSRYHGSIRTMTSQAAQELANIDYSKDMAIIGLVGPRTNLQIVAEARYSYNPNNNMGEFDVLVVDAMRGFGIGSLLSNYLKKIAYSRGLSGVYAEVLQNNLATIGLMNKVWSTARKQFDSGICIFTLEFPAEDVLRPKDSIIIYSGRFNDYTYGKRHPFRPERARETMNLITEEGFLGEPWMRVEEPHLIPKERLIESHDPAFINALEKANDGQWKEEYLQFGLGGDDTPVFEGMFDYILLYTSATLTGVNQIIKEDANVVFNLLGGFHHASRNHAEGFCYVNDIIIAIDTLLAHGLRVACIDIDAHHGNGVQDAYYKDDRVLTISLHETGKTLYPWSGFENEIGEGPGEGFNINVPLPSGTDDEAFEWCFDSLITYAVKRFAPNVVVVVAGADTHKNDPLTNLNLTNNGMMEAIRKIRDYCPHMLMLTAGGYDLRTTTKAWCRMWAAANRIDALPDYLLTIGGHFMGEEGLPGAQMVDRAYRVSGKEKIEILEELERVVKYHEEHTIPIIRARSGEDAHGGGGVESGPGEAAAPRAPEADTGEKAEEGDTGENAEEADSPWPGEDTAPGK